MKIYGEYVENDTDLNKPNRSTSEPSWSQFLADAKKFEGWARKGNFTIRTRSRHSPLSPPYAQSSSRTSRSSIWASPTSSASICGYRTPGVTLRPGYSAYVVEHPVVVLGDHTGGPPTPDAEQADNDLAIGRIIDDTSATVTCGRRRRDFIEEDDAQNGVDHVDSHRSPGYSHQPIPYVPKRTHWITPTTRRST